MKSFPPKISFHGVVVIMAMAMVLLSLQPQPSHIAHAFLVPQRPLTPITTTKTVTSTTKAAATTTTTTTKSRLWNAGSSSSSDAVETSPPSSSSIDIDNVKEELMQVQKDIQAQLEACETVQQVEEIRRETLGKKGPIQASMRYMKSLSPNDKPQLGMIVNQVKATVEDLIVTRKEVLEELQMQQDMELQKIDVTKPGLTPTFDIGRRHPLSMTMEKAVNVFTKLGYDTVTSCEDSPEVETDYYCFEALNCPKDHPARDMQDTFYLSSDRELMLRTHTSAVQIRQLEKRKPPLRIVAPGRVYRRDDIDATHSLMFHQVEILALEPVGELDLGHLKGTVEHFLKEMLGPQIETRFRGSYFPFTEPSMEVDVKFRGQWMEVLGCGMVDPRVLEKAGIDPTEYAGFAAGFGVERFAMIIHGVKDLREFVKSDVRFLKQFPHFYDDGMVSFLKGDPPKEAEQDFRSEQLPHTIVESVEELKNYQYKQQEQEGEEGKEEEEAPSKKAKKEAAAATPATTSDDEIDISKLDIRVGIIQKVWEHPEADKLYCEEIDLGEEDGPRQIASGLKQHYSLEEMEGRKVLVLANLKARKLMGFPSHGMVLCASSSSDNNKVQFIDPPANAKVGERITVEGYVDGDGAPPPATENQVMKKKMLDVIFPDLKTNGNGVATYKGVPLMTSAGPCQAKDLPNAPIA